jgi:ubiquinone/menaquinone biosynthesis C-methylase UbiE
MDEKAKYAKMWASRRYESSRIARAFRNLHLIEYIRRPCLDVGCGDGYVVEQLLALGIDAVGVDLTANAWDVVSEVNPTPSTSQNRLVEACATQLPFACSQFSTSLSITLLEHLPLAHVQAAIREMVRVASYSTIHVIDVRNPHVHEGLQLHMTTRPLVWWSEKFKAELLRQEKELILMVIDKEQLEV